MKKLLPLLALLALPAQAQQVTMPPPAGTVAILCAFNTSPATITTGFPAFVQCDNKGNLLVNVNAGSLSLTGTTSNASSGVATSSTNVPTVAYTYGFNGTTWDQLQVDGSKNLKTAVNVALPAGANVIGQVSVNQTTFGTTNGVVSAANTYNTVAASQTAQALTGGSGGATGDYLSHCVVTPGTTSPGVVTVLDNAVSVIAFAGGASSVSNLVPFALPIGAKSVSGAWKITTGANVTVVCVGKFT